jgi:hypothetical protein
MADPVGSSHKSSRVSNTEGAAHTEGLPPAQGDPYASASSIGQRLTDALDEASKEQRADRALEESMKEEKLDLESNRIAEMEQEAADAMDRKMSAANAALIIGIAMALGALGVLGAYRYGVFGLGGVAHEIPSSLGNEAVVPEAGLPAGSEGEPAGANEGPASAPAAPPSAGCEIKLVYPPAPTAIPEIGPIDLQWTRVPEAAVYSLEVDPPPGAGAPWLISTTLTSKQLYMENFPAGGAYGVLASALSAKGDVLCAARLTFEKPASELPGKSSKEKEGGGAVPCDPQQQKQCP